MTGTQFDITDRKKVEAERDRLFELSTDMLAVSDFGGNLKQTNPAWAKVLGWTKEELLSKLWIEFVHPEDRPQTIGIKNILESGDPIYSFENRFQCKDGTYKWLSWNATPLADENLIFSVCRDITLQKDEEAKRIQLEEQLTQALKMESIGRLAGGVAHDLNNMLSPIIGYSELALINLTDDDPMYGDVIQIRNAAERAKALTRQLLAFSRKQVLDIKVLDLNKVVTSFREMIGKTIRDDIEIEAKLSDTLGSIKADPAQIEQILINIAVNAEDAMPEGGTLTIETSNVYLDAMPKDTSGKLPAGRYVKMTVSDTGRGIPPDIQDLIFEPFFTTKERGKGTGLGLSTVYGIVAQHGGEILVESKQERGTAFKIYLPRCDGEPDIADDKIRAKPGERGTENVIVVEDDITVLHLTCQILSNHGYNVIDVEDPLEAIEIFKQNGKNIQVLLTDVIMPKMHGKELYENLVKMNPDLKVLFMSGYTDDVISRHGVLEEKTYFLQKPFTVKDLMDKMRDVLDDKKT
jgi:two-component system, cell cycle sensor histidine kinase and response regulator CckA